MDGFSHAAWGATIIRSRQLVGWAALTGALPDIIPAAYGVFKYRKRYFADMVNQSFVRNPESNYLKVYYYCHSLIPISIVTLLVLAITPRAALLAVPYYLHLGLDVLTHRGIWATRLFYPLSHVAFQGWDWWKNKWFSIGNWLVIVSINIILIYVI